MVFAKARKKIKYFVICFIKHFTTFEAMKIKIDSDINISPRLGRKLKYPFPDMKVGDSFWFETKPVNLLTSFRAWCNRGGRKWKAQCCTEIKNGKKGARIKRVK